MKNKVWIIFLFSGGLFIQSCSDTDRKEIPEKEPVKEVSVPSFNADSAYHFVEKQISFGPRVPNMPSHEEAGNYLINKLESNGAKVQVQEFEAHAYDGRLLQLRNIIGIFNPDKEKRIMLAAHWDTRHVADRDTVRTDQPIDGANDGASGVAVLLEIARLIGANPPDVGVDIFFFDGEDNAEPLGYTGPFPQGESKTYWCLGSQYWSKNKHKKGYYAYYGILLDMVGAKGAQFHQEGISRQAAGKVLKKVWDAAHRLGYSEYFIHRSQPEIVDDHVFVNRDAKIPMINIVNYDPQHGYFGDWHHTHRDNIDIIDKETLRVVGQTVAYVLYHE